MLILSLESSAKPSSVAVCRDGELLGLYFQNSGLNHSHTLMKMAEALLQNLGVAPSELGLVAVSHGPGSFTGVRIGVSAAKGLAWGLGIPVCGVSTLEAMAYQATEPGLILSPVMDARRGQVYNALFEWREGTLVRLREDRAIPLDDLAADIASDAFASTLPVCLIGDGTSIAHEHFLSLGINHRIPQNLVRWQTAYGVALAAAAAGSVPAAELEPRYLRPSQAERVRNERQGNG